MRSIAAASLLIGATLLAGCSAGPDVSLASTALPSPTPPATVVAGSSPLGLFGSWRVSGVDGEEPDARLRIGLGSVEVWRSCGWMAGSWVAGAIEFRAVSTSSAQGCASEGPWSWIEAVESYHPTADGWILRADDGSAVAELTADERPDSPEWAGQTTMSTEIGDRARAMLDGVVEVPDGIEPVSAEDLWGRWVPEGEFEADPHIVFSRGGRWWGSDGCNRGGGKWVLSEDGEFNSTSSAMFLRGCDGAPAPLWVTRTNAIGLDEDELVLLDLEGVELGRLVRP